jgi:hypothetical protein
VPLLFIATIFCSAVLLFLIQPLFANMVLPMLGGSPAVWNTATMFYQLVLLAGYVYAHVIKTRLSSRAQAIVHSIVIVVPLLTLPIAVPAGWEPPTESTPVLWMIGLLGVGVALPFFALSTTSSLTQAWYSRLGVSGSKDPYFLYAASNIGSMVGLLGYPLLMQPTLRLQSQSWLWSAGYGLFVALLLATTWLTYARSRTAISKPVEATAAVAASDAPAPGWGRRLLWIALAFTPSSLMLSVTTYISTDVAAIPLLWVVPLALYLLTYIIVFARRQFVSQATLRFWMGILLIPLAVMLIAQLGVDERLAIGLHLITFFLVTLVCHGQLVASRPDARYLTEFYLWMSLGGALGGTFNAMIAPMVFRSVTEYPLVLALPALLVALARSNREDMRRHLKGDLGFVLAVAGVMSAIFASVSFIREPIAQAATAVLGNGTALASEIAARGTVVVVVTVVGILSVLVGRRMRQALALTALFVVGTAWQSVIARPLAVASGSVDVLTTRRSFFGVNHVHKLGAYGTTVLMHGTTVHGGQHLAPERQCETFSYYHRRNEIGAIFEQRANTWARARIGVVGLGTGALAAYAQPGQDWTFYEIDPDVRDIATDPTLFTYLSKCAPQAKVVLGDARLQLARAPAEQKFDLLVLDAYSSDAIPMHLITKEAMALYRSKLTDNGLIAFHISNRFFDLRPALGNIADVTGMVGLTSRCRAFKVDNIAAGKSSSRWVLLAKRRADIADFAGKPAWKELRGEAAVPVWTDDFSSLLTALSSQQASGSESCPEPAE